MSLRLRLMLAFIAVVVVPLVVAAVLVARGVPGYASARERDQVGVEARAVASSFAQVCTNAQTAATALGWQAAATTRTSAVQRSVTGLVAYAAFARPDGTVLAEAGALPAVVRASLGGRPPGTLVSCLSGPASPAGAVIGSAPVRDQHGRTTGIAVVAVPVDRTLLGRLAAPLTTGSQHAVTLLRGGRVIASTLPAADAARLAGSGVERAAEGAATVRTSRVASRLVATYPAQERVIDTVVVSGPEHHSDLVPTLLAVLAATLLLAAVLGWQLARVMTRPLRQLAEAASRVAEGDLDTPVPRPVGAGAEVVKLADAFSDMTDELRVYIGELEDSRDELRRNVARLGDTLSSTHDLQRILQVILDGSMASVRAQAGALYMTSTGRGELYLRVANGLEDRGAASRVRVGDGVVGRVAATGEPLTGRVVADPAALSADGAGWGAGATRPGQLPARRDELLVLGEGEPSAAAVIAMPLKGQGRVIGVLGLYDRFDGREFEQGDVETIRSFASQATVAIDNVLLHQEAQRLSITDGLTGLWNYRYFTMNFAKEIERASRFARPLSLLLLDLDKFKDVNDAHGHQRGDSVLIELATRVKGEIREVDTLARYGGEEFVLVLPETDADGAAQVAQRICDVVRSRAFGHEDEEPLRITVSIGVAVFPDHGTSAAALIRAADVALYAMKEQGRDGWRLADNRELAPNS